MKKVLDKYLMCPPVLILLTLCFVISGCAGIQYADIINATDITQLDSKEKTARVLALADEWRNSGVIVKKGLKYKITATGNWTAGAICGLTGPDGFGISALCSGATATYTGRGSASLLLGKIGTEGSPFFVGKDLDLIAGDEGILYFRINDTPMWMGDNSGFVDVVTSLMRPATEAIAKVLPEITNQTAPTKGSPPAEKPSIFTSTSDIDELPAIKAKPNKNSYAIVIGIENYRQKLPKADFAVADAKTVTEYLTKVMGYPEENVVTLTNDHAAKSDFEKYFEKWLPNNVEKGSSVFIYYSGHGAPNVKTGDAYLVPYDGDPSFIEQTGYSLKKLYESLNKLQAKEIIVALDSCFSGAGGKSVIAKGARPLVMNLEHDIKFSKNMIVMSASSGDQISSTYEEKGHGLFTYFMLKGIKNEDVTRQDGSIKMDVLFGYLKPQVERIARKQYNNEQTPQLIGGKKK